jgi:hypothetical protein
MARSYQADEIKEKLIDILQNQKTGLSGLEISERIGINRITMTKYLQVFAAEGFIKQKNIGNVIIWFIEDGTEQFHFPDDYFKIKSKYLEFITERLQNHAYNLIRNCLHSKAKPTKIIIDVIVPAIKSVDDLFHKGKIGNSELNLLEKIISNSIQIINLESFDTIPKKNTIVISADQKSVLLSEAASACLHAEGWHVYSLGDMSTSIDVLFDLDLQKFVAKIWKPGSGIMIITIFSSTVEGMKFFSESINAIKGKFGKKLYLALCGNVGKNSNVKADLLEEDLEMILQRSETRFQSSFS